jgi:exodeoxyribonuclease-5
MLNAGSGKSTLVKFIISALNLPEDKVAYVAYTGKAANVLKQKGCPNATTAHKLLYYAQKTPAGNFIFKPKPSLEIPYRLIVVDEVSMLPKDMWNLLLSHHIYVLACGDPGQLPPINKDQINDVLDNPQVFLDEIMRQAQESAIIRLSMHIREGKDFRTFPTVSGEVRIIPHARELYNNLEDYNSCLLGAEQIICGTNAQRTKLNNAVRALQGRDAEPELGDRLIGLTNHWDFLSEQHTALTNGAIGDLSDINMMVQSYPKRLGIEPVQLMLSNIKMDDGDEFIDVPIDYNQLITGTPSLSPQQEYKVAQYIKNFKRIDCEPPKLPYDFAYGYAITCWKSQGSEWNTILGFDATWVKNKNPEEYTQYLYTLVTRASQTIILVGD